MRPTAAGRRFARAITVGTKPNHSFWPSFAYANLPLWGSVLIVWRGDSRGMFSLVVESASQLSAEAWRKCASCELWASVLLLWKIVSSYRLQTWILKFKFAVFKSAFWKFDSQRKNSAASATDRAVLLAWFTSVPFIRACVWVMTACYQIWIH